MLKTDGARIRAINPSRQVEARQLMISAGNFMSVYAKALLVATKGTETFEVCAVEAVQSDNERGACNLRTRTEARSADFEMVKAAYGEEMPSLVVAAAYIAKLIANRRIERCLDDNRLELLGGFRRVASAASLDDFKESRRLSPRALKSDAQIWLPYIL
jgi:hypothetical protein